MARIVPSDQAPAEAVSYSFAGAEFTLGGSGKGTKKVYTSDDADVISSAVLHPWLDVQYDEVPEEDVRYTGDDLIKPEDDLQSAQSVSGQIPFDEEEIRKVEDAKLGVVEVVEDPAEADAVVETTADTTDVGEED